MTFMTLLFLCLSSAHNILSYGSTTVIGIFLTRPPNDTPHVLCILRTHERTSLGNGSTLRRVWKHTAPNLISAFTPLRLWIRPGALWHKLVLYLLLLSDCVLFLTNLTTLEVGVSWD
jgi:hypothetical protein